MPVLIYILNQLETLIQNVYRTRKKFLITQNMAESFGQMSKYPKIINEHIIFHDSKTRDLKD